MPFVDIAMCIQRQVLNLRFPNIEVGKKCNQTYFCNKCLTFWLVAHPLIII